MTTATTPTIPDLPGFEEHHGIRVSWIGEDGDMVALGHHDPRHALAAFNACAKRVGLSDLLDGYGKYLRNNWKRALNKQVEQRWAITLDDCRECGGDPECGRCREIKAGIAEGGWWMEWSEEPAPGAFPIMYWSA